MSLAHCGADEMEKEPDAEALVLLSPNFPTSGPKRPSLFEFFTKWLKNGSGFVDEPPFS